MKYARRVVSVILAMMILTMLAFTVSAAPRWSYITTIAADMAFDDEGIVTISIMCDSDLFETNKITAKCELQQFKNGAWKTIKTWTETDNSSSVMYEKTYAVAKNYSYRLKMTASAYMDSELLEQVTGEYAEKFYR